MSGKNKRCGLTVSGALVDVVLPGGKHTGSSQYDVYSLDGMAGDGRREDGKEVGDEERRGRRV